MDSISYKLGLTNDQKFDYQKAHTLEERIQLRTLYIERRPQYQLVICEPHFSLNKSQRDKAILNVSKLLFADTDTVLQIQKYIRQGLTFELNRHESIYVFSRNVMLQTNFTIKELKEKYLDPEDGILYIKYARQDTFGAHQQ